MNKQADIFYNKYQNYFMKVPSTIKELEVYVPFITPLFDNKRFTGKEFSIIIITTIIQLVIYGLNILYLQYLKDLHKHNLCKCSQNEVLDYIYWYAILKSIFLILVLLLYTARYNKILPVFIEELTPLLSIMSAVDLVTLFPVFLYTSDIYYSQLAFNRCHCSDSGLKYIPHTFSWLTVTSYTIIIAALIHAIITMIFSYLIWKVFFNK